MTYTITTEDPMEQMWLTHATKMHNVLFNIIFKLGKDCDYLEEANQLTVENIKNKINEYTQEIQHLYE